MLAPWLLAHALIPALPRQRQRQPNLGYIASSESARATECSSVCKQNTLAPAICLLFSSLPKSLSDEDVLRDLLIQELLAWMVDQTELCQLRWGARGPWECCKLISLSSVFSSRCPFHSQLSLITFGPGYLPRDRNPYLVTWF